MDMLPTMGADPAMLEQPVNADPPKMIEREAPSPDASRAELVTDWLGKVQKARTHWKPKFEKMRTDMAFVRGKQWPNGSEDAYVCNITLRHIQQRTSAIYAKNPKFAVKRKPRMDFQMWDGTPEEIQEAMAGLPDPVTAGMLLLDVKEGIARRKMLRRIGKTMEIMFLHALDEQAPTNFKVEMKQLIRRTKTLGVGYVQVGYQRIKGYSGDLQTRIQDDQARLQELERLAADIADGVIHDNQKEIEQLRIGIKALQDAPDLVLREGLTFDFVRVDKLIVDPACTQLKGFRDAEWLALECTYKPERVRAIYKKDVGTGSAGEPASPHGSATMDDKGCCRVYIIYDLRLKVKFAVCEGYKDFLEEPGEPDVWLEQFHPFFALTFNDVEDDKDPYPPCDVDLIRHGQREINRSSEARRLHRIASRPAYVGAKGLFSDEDKQKLRDHEEFEFLELDAMSTADGAKIADKLMAKPVQTMDAQVYETDSVYNDVLRATGDQEANLGPTSEGTATEATIAENSRVTSLQSEIDDLEEFMSAVARAAGQILLTNVDEATAKQIAGPGAAWPAVDAARKEVASELYLEIRAGSSGRPNRALRIANKERLAPFMLQIPGVSPSWLFRTMAEELDEGDDLEEAFTPGLPSITAMNSNPQPSTGDPATDPNAQGPQGGNNQPAPPGQQQGPQPAMPTGAPQVMPMPRRMGGAGVV